MKTKKKIPQRRLVSFLLMLCMAISLLPSAALAASLEQISKVAVTGFVEPKVGATPITKGNLKVPADAKYIVSGAQWMKDGEPLRDTGWTFEAGHTYQCIIQLSADQARAMFVDPLTATLNGVSVKAERDNEYNPELYARCYSKEYKAGEISKVEVLGLQKPIPGKVCPGERDLSVPEDANYYVSSVEWYGLDQKKFSVFNDDLNSYRCTIALQAQRGYAFSDSPAVTLKDARTNEDIAIRSVSVQSGSKDLMYIETDYLQRTVSSVAITGFREPKAGETAISAEDLKVADNLSCGIRFLQWLRDDSTSAIMEKNFTFEAGHTYRCLIGLKTPYYMYEFADTGALTATLNGKRIKVERDPNNTGVQEHYAYCYTEDFTLPKLDPSQKEVIYKVEISGYKAPKLGGKCVTRDALQIPADAKYEMTSVLWSEDYHLVKTESWQPDTFIKMGDFAFRPGHKYVCDIILSSEKSGAEFAENDALSATVNDKNSLTDPSVGIKRAAFDPGFGEAVNRVSVTVGPFIMLGEGTLLLTDADQALSFSDVIPSNWFYSAVQTAYGMGLINGKSSTSYAPGDNMSHSEAIKLAACMHQLYNEGKITLTNGSANWYDPYVAYARENGIPWEYPDYTAAITRAEYVHIFYHALPESHYTADGNAKQPGDLTSSHPYFDEIMTFYRAGILTGTDKGVFAPDSSITRAEVATILTRMMDVTQRVKLP